MISNIRIVLVNPSHPGNIGAAARAMKTMGLSRLYLVNPKIFPHVTATALAAGADDILEQATITSTLIEALTGVNTVFGTSARFRILQLPTLEPKKAAAIIHNELKVNHQLAILFGRENNGLSNEELELCNYQLHIPTNPNFNSLNIAAAVQLIAYEISMALEATTTPNCIPNMEPATIEEVQFFYEHLQQTLTAINFLCAKNQQRLMAKIKLLFNRTQLEKTEVNLLRGILTAINAATKLLVKDQ